MANSTTIPIQSKHRSAARVLLKTGLITLVLLIVIVILGASYGVIEMRIDARRFPIVGRLVDIGGYKLNINCAGEGSPTVILESGNGETATYWRRVQPEIAKFAHVCSYDRAGYGWSDPSPAPRTSAQMVKELHALLQNSAERPPYILVGHSLGGLNVRLYNSVFPNETVGMVLAESTHEDLRLPPSIQKLSENDVKRREHNRDVAPFLYWSGLSRFQARKLIGNPAVPYATQQRIYLNMRPAFVDATTSEVESLNEDYKEVRASGTLGDMPLIVLTAGKGVLGSPLTSQDWIDLQTEWVSDLQMQLTHLSSRGKRIMLLDSDHAVPLERPDAIVEAVREVRTAAAYNPR